MAGLKPKEGHKGYKDQSETLEKLIIEWGEDEKKNQIDYKAYPGKQKFDNEELAERTDQISKRAAKIRDRLIQN